jgi:hypothetical protein
MKRFSLVVACALVALMAAVPAAPVRAAEAEHEAAAKLLEALNMEKVFNDAINATLDLQIKQNPQLARLRGVMSAFFAKNMSWAALKDEIAAAYAAEFTAAELDEMTAFFKTPTGKKFASKQSLLMAKGMEIGQRRVQANMPELQRAIQEEMQKPAPQP